MSRVLLGMSGGVHSSATALFLKEMGYKVIGVYMKLHNNEAYHRENFQKAKKVAKYFGVELKILDITDRFNREVYNYFISSYKIGLTPNPCIVCNREIKFGEMIKYADNLEVDFISTGHYVKSDGEFIYKAMDKTKDQSYFLSQIEKSVIKRLVFPLGNKLKSEVKEIIKDIRVLKDISTQKESSEICFVEDSYTDVLKEYIEIDIPGEVIDKNGKVIGSHKGYMHYTIGKRRGFRVNGAHEPHYVLSLDVENNRIVVAKRDELFVDEVELEDVNLFDSLKNFNAEVKLRYRTKGVKANIEVANGSAKIHLQEPVFGVANGQYGVFYDGDRVLGGGIIVGSSKSK